MAENDMPELLRDLVIFVNRWPASPRNVWRRCRIAMTEEEIDQIRTFFRSDNGKEFIWAIRGVPLVLELHPEQPMYLMELLEAGQPSEVGYGKK